jgi:hypothetical protein
MCAPRHPALPPVEFLRQALVVDDEGALRWRDRPEDNHRHTGRLAGSMQRGRRIVSIRDESGVLRTALADRVLYALTHGHWPTGVVEIVGGQPVDRPRHARSPGRGGLKAERSRDTAVLVALADRPLTVSGVASAVGSEPTNVRRRLSKLAAWGLVARPEHCPCQRNGEPVPPGMWRAWTLTGAGADRAREATAEPVAPEPWLRVEAISAAAARDVVERHNGDLSSWQRAKNAALGGRTRRAVLHLQRSGLLERVA